MGTLAKVVTYEEWLRMPEVDGVEEVVDGEIRVMPPNRWAHARIVSALRRQLEAQLDLHSIDVVDTVFGLVIRREPLTMRVPDIAVFTLANIVEIDGHIHSAPELLVEVLSPANTRSEMSGKIRDYESIGVPELWIVSPEARAVEILQLTANRLTTTSIVNSGEIRPKRFPQAAIDVTKVWP